MRRTMRCSSRRGRVRRGGASARGVATWHNAVLNSVAEGAHSTFCATLCHESCESDSRSLRPRPRTHPGRREQARRALRPRHDAGRVASAARHVLEADRVSVWLHDAATDELVLKMSGDLEPVRVPAGTGLVGSCARQPHGVLVALHDGIGAAQSQIARWQVRFPSGHRDGRGLRRTRCWPATW